MRKWESGGALADLVGGARTLIKAVLLSMLFCGKAG